MLEINIIDSSSSSNSDEGDMEVLHLPRRFKARVNYNDILTDFTFKEKFRIHAETANYLLNRIGPVIQHTTGRSYSLSAHQQLLTTLHWLGGGAQYHSVADMHGISKATVHRSIYRVCKAVVEDLMAEEVKWPIDDVLCVRNNS